MVSSLREELEDTDKKASSLALLWKTYIECERLLPSVPPTGFNNPSSLKQLSLKDIYAKYDELLLMMDALRNDAITSPSPPHQVTRVLLQGTDFHAVAKRRRGFN